MPKTSSSQQWYTSLKTVLYFTNHRIPPRSFEASCMNLSRQCQDIIWLGQEREETERKGEGRYYKCTYRWWEAKTKHRTWQVFGTLSFGFLTLFGWLITLFTSAVWLTLCTFYCVIALL